MRFFNVIQDIAIVRKVRNVISIMQSNIHKGKKAYAPVVMIINH